MPARYSLNSLSNLVTVVVSMGVAMWFTPYLLDHLGIAEYGLIPVATSASAVLTLLTTALTTTVGRYLTMALAQGDVPEARRTFNTALFGALYGTLALLPLAAIASVAVPFLLSVPPGAEDEARWLFLTVMLAVLSGTVSTVFGLSAFARNRFDLRNAVQIVSLAVRVGLVVALFEGLLPSVAWAGLGTLGSALVLLAGNVVLWRTLTPEIGIRKSDFALPHLRELAGMTTWISVDQAGVILYRHVDILLINALWNEAWGGEYGILVQIVWLVPVIAATLASPLQPPIFAAAGAGDPRRLAKTVVRGSRPLAVAMGLVVGLFFGFGERFIDLWIGPTYAHLYGPMGLGVALIALSQVSQPLLTLLVAEKRHRLLGTTTVTTGAGHFAFALALLLIGPGIGLWPLVLSGGLWRLVKTHIILPRATSLPAARRALFRHSLLTLLVGAAATGAGLGVTALWPAGNWAVFFTQIAVTGAFAAAAYLALLATPEERAILERHGFARRGPVAWILALRRRTPPAGDPS